MFQPEIYQLLDLQGDEWKQVLSIYEVSFPKNEKQSVSILQSRIEQGDEIVLVAKEKECIVGFAFVFDLDKAYLLLDYLAVKKDSKNAGVGSLLLSHVKILAFQKSKSLIIEVDEPIESVSINRVRFYTKNKVRLISDFLYLLPPLEGSKPTRQNLYIVPLENSKAFLSETELKDIVSLLYRKVYSLTFSDDLYKITTSALYSQYALN